MSSAITFVRTGGCQCGAIRYELTAQPLEIYICHCRECQRQSASAFGISVIVRSACLRLVRGAPGKWSRPSDSGTVVHCFFCPDCGSRVWHGDRDSEATVSIKGGSLDEPVDIADVPHIWTIRKLPGVVIPGHMQTFEKEPD